MNSIYKKIQKNSAYGVFGKYGNPMQAKKFYISKELKIKGQPWYLIYTYTESVMTWLQDQPMESCKRVKKHQFFASFKISEELLTLLTLRWGHNVEG